MFIAQIYCHIVLMDSLSKMAGYTYYLTIEEDNEF